MSARSPFRSHLMQQWTQSRRSPVAVQPWLRQATIDEEEEDLSSRTPRSSRRNQKRQSRRSLHHSSPKYNPRTLPSVDSSSSTPSIVFATKMFASPLKLERNDHVNNVDTKQYVAGSNSSFDSSNARIKIKTRTQQGEREHLQHGQKNESLRHSTGKSHPERIPDKMGPRRKAMQEPASFRPPFAKNIRDQESGGSTFASAKTAQNEEKEDRKALCVAIDRAVTKLSERRVVQDHQPFTFRRFFSSSQSGLRLIDICFHVVLRQTKDSSMAMIERNKWLAVPAFLVALVHDNQSDDIGKDVEPYEELDYSPPATEGQLEDYASACAATQSVVHHLEENGFSCAWNTGAVIKTPAFRSLVQAVPTDRIAALIMVNWLRSPILDPPREENDCRERYGSSLQRDLLVDLV